MHSTRRVLLAASAILFSLAVPGLDAQSAGRSGTISGTVADPTGAIIPNATVTIQNPVSGLSRKTTSDSDGQYLFANLPLATYHLKVSATGFSSAAQDVEIRSIVPVAVTTSLQIGGTSTEITVSAASLSSNESGLETEVDRASFDQLIPESQSSGLSALVSTSSPGIASDSNGSMHGLGDHASNTFSVDDQQITDQQSKTFSNQLPSNSVQSISVIEGAPPAEYGGKTSLVIEVTTRSGLGVTTPSGSFTASYGTFGSATGSIDLSYGGKNFGNFIEIDGLNTGRFLDSPEFAVMHDKGNEQNLFDRVDRRFTAKDSAHLDFSYSRSWFQTPNTFDNLNVTNISSGGATPSPAFSNLGNADQRSKIVTFNIAPGYTHVLNPSSVFTFGPYVRRDSYNYYPSNNPLADLGPPNLQTSSIAQARTLTNAGLHTNVSYIKGVNNIKLGGNYSQTFLRENDALGVVDSHYNAPCTNASGNPVPGFSNPGQCTGTLQPNPGFNPVLAPFDLTRNGGLFRFVGHTDVKELALYLQDQIKAGNWLFNVGLRGDLYNGLATAHQVEPRVGLSYTVKRTGSVLRASYARTLESPFNENLVLSSEGCGSPVLSPLLACTPGVSTTLQPGFRNEFHAGFEQSFTRHLVLSADYIWKYTHNAFDFSVLGNTPITFPIDWHNAKVPGYALRADVPNLHNFSGYLVLSSVAARFFPPQTAGAGATVGQSGQPFRIDHDEKLNETTHIQYQFPGKRAPSASLNWHYDSGLTATSTPCFNLNSTNSVCTPNSIFIGGQPGINLSGLTPDEQFEAGLTCNKIKATPYSGFSQCLVSQLTSSLLSIPAPNTENDDKNPPRVAPRSVFDASFGIDNLFAGDKHKWSTRLTAVNVTNKYALYNFLSTFSGTHYLTPRALTAELTFHF